MAARKRKRGKARTGEKPPVSGVAAVRERPPPGVLLGAAALAAMILVVYFPALTGEPLWDDAVWAEEPLVLSWSGIREIWLEPSAIRQEGHYWPIVYTSFWLEHKLWGLAPLGYHLVNVLLHLANTLLAWRLLTVLRVPGAWAAAAVFAVHPLHVESVAWIVERKDLLSTLFYFGAALAWIRPGGPRIMPAAILLVAALLSKSMPVTFPAALLIWYWWREKWPSTREAAGLTLLFAVSLSITLADLSFYASREALSLGYSFVERVQIASHALWFYAGKLIWPSNLAVIYPHWEIGLADVVSWLYVAAAIAAAALLWFGRRRIGRAPVAAVAFFALTLAPSLGFIDYGYMQFSFAADRFQYLAGLGLIALAAAAAAQLAERHRLLEKAAPVVLAAALAAFGAVTWNQAGIYRDGIVFFEHVISHNFTARDAHANLGAEYMNAGRNEEGLQATLIATEQRPEYAGAFLNLGLAYLRLERLQEAETAVLQALELDPEYRDARQNLGEVYRRRGEHEAAAEQYREALEIDPDSAPAYAGLGQSLFQLGRDAEAVEAIDRAIESGLETFQAADEALSLAREAVRIDEGLFTRSQTPLLIMQAENLSNSNDWAKARKLQDHLIWLFQSKFATPDQFMIDELRTMSRLHMHGVERDVDAYRAYHFTRALYNNRLAMDVADAFWPSNDERKAELIHDHLQILHARASQAMNEGLLFGDSPAEAPSAGRFVLNLSEKLMLGGIRDLGIQYLARMRQLVDGDSGNAPEILGIVNLYEAEWLSLFDRNAEAAEIHDLSRSLFEQAGISEQVIDRLMVQPMLQPGMEYYASAERILTARSRRTSGGMTNAVSFSSMSLHPFADLFLSSPPNYASSASAAP